MMIETEVPKELKETQKWFASIITRPIDEVDRMMPLSPSGRPIAEEAREFIASSPTMEPDERIEIYNQQHWWRFLSNMQEGFPFVTRLFGRFEFNQRLAIPYLIEHPIKHWSLNQLGNLFPQWLRENYLENDRELVYGAADIDYAFNFSFIAPQGQFDHFDGIDTKPLTWQPHVRLFKFPYQLFDFREAFLKQEPEYWQDQDFPKLVHAPENQYFYYLLYRNHLKTISIDTISEAEYLALEFFKTPSSIDQFCEWLEEQPEENLIVKEAEKSLQQWLQHWASREILSFV